MCKKVMIGCSSILFLILVACGTSEEDSPGDIHADIEVQSFPEAVENADLIADVTIIKQVGERDKPSPKTTFNTQINQIIKGDIDLSGENILVDQQGNSEWIFNDNDLFKKEQQYILFLKKTIGTDESDYWIQGEETGVFKEVETGISVKLAYSADELETLDVSSTLNGKTIQTLENNPTFKDYQTVDKDHLIDRIKEEISN